MNKIITFESGLRLVLDNMKSTRALSIGVYVGVGCLYETKENNGISHFIEHMLFKGTKTRSSYDIVNQLESIGVNINAYTSKNVTAYYTVGLSEYANNCMELLSDMYFNSTFSDENMMKEKGVVLEEINMNDDDNEDICLENLASAHYGKAKPIAYPILGSSTNVSNFTKEDIQEFMAANYTPQNTVISMAGDITYDEAILLVNKYFEVNMKNEEYQKPKLYSNSVKSKYIERIKTDCQQSHIAISFPMYSLKKKNKILNNIFCNILAGGMSSRLFQKIREELGLVYTIYASPVSYVDDAYMFIYFATDPSKVPLAVKEIRKALDEILEKGFTNKEIERSIIQAKTTILLGMESSTSVMRVNARSVVLLDEKYKANKQVKELDKITKEKLDEMAKYVLNYKKSSFSYVGKKPNYNIYKLFNDEE
jgi:predicted Zn-dependent peptidase